MLQLKHQYLRKTLFCVHRNYSTQNAQGDDLKWLNRSVFNLSDRLQLPPMSSKMLLNLFTSKDGIARLRPCLDPSKREEAQKSIIDLMEEHQNTTNYGKKQLLQVLDHLQGEFSLDEISPNKVQARFFSERIKFFPNYGILQKFHSAYSDPVLHNFYFIGPRNLGKSFNLALFRFLLLTDPQTNRVMYINNLDAWFRDPKPIKHILNDLQFTFADHLQDGDHQKFDLCYLYEIERLPFNKRLLALENLLSHHMAKAGSEKRILIIDQWNLMSRMIETAKTRRGIEKILTQRVEIINILSSAANKYMRIASLTDEDYEKETQEWQVISMYDRLDEPVCQEFIADTFKGTTLSKEDFSIIEETSGKIPGEIVSIMRQPGDRIDDKIKSYNEIRPDEISRDLELFYQKREKSLSGQSGLALLLDFRKQIAAAIDVDVCIPNAKSHSYFYYDRRYIYVNEKSLIKSVFPAVRQAYRRYHDRSENIKILTSLYEMKRMSEFGQYIERMILTELPRTKATYSIKLLEKEESMKSLPTEISFKMQIASPIPQGFKDYTSFELPIPSPEMSMVLLTPYKSTYRGMDFLLIIPSEALVLAVQIKYSSRLFTEWKSFIKPEKTFSPSSVAYKESKEVLKARCIDNGYKVVFVLMYLLEDKTFTYENVKKGFGEGEHLYFWEAKQLEIFEGFQV